MRVEAYRVRASHPRTSGTRSGSGALVPCGMVRVLHVPLPLSRRGNTLMGVVSELGRSQVGRRCRGRGRRERQPRRPRRRSRQPGRRLHDLLPAPVVHPFASVGATTVSARLGRRRRHTGDLYLPAIEAAAAWGPDLLLLYEGLATCGTVPAWRRALPDARIVVYMHSPLLACLREGRTGPFPGRCRCRGVRLAVPPHAVRRAGAGPGGQGDRRGERRRPDSSSTRTPTGPSAVGPVPTGRPSQLLFVGQVAPHKGPDLMLRAMDDRPGPDRRRHCGPRWSAAARTTPATS